MRFELLGQVQFRDGDTAIDIRRRQERCLLCLLVLEAGRLVPAERLLDLLWDGDPPSSGRATLHTYVARLRQSLAPHGVNLVTRSGGYLAEVDPGSVDVHQFTAGLASAQEITEPRARLARLAEILALWRGPLMADVADSKLRDRLGASLAEQHLTALEMHAQAQLDCGQHQQAAKALAELIALHPLREGFAELLMTALHQGGRRAEALHAYRQLRGNLRGELGIEPSPRLQALHQRILKDEEPEPDPAPRRQFLPADVADFTGRSGELSWLDDFRVSQASRAVLISAIAGMGGVGKTALAVHWAHRAASAFPDGQLYVNLRGYDPGQPLRPLDALLQCLRHLGTPAAQLPHQVDEAAALYRSQLAGKKVLILLDNARTADQVRPLLPGDQHSMVLVTSRDRLTGLVAKDGARRLTLDVLSHTEALALVRKLIPAARVAAEPAAIDELIRACAHIPLALGIAAAHLADRPEETVTAYLDDLRSGGRLNVLAVEGDHDNAVQAVLGRSFQSLRTEAREAIVLLAAIPWPDFTAEAGAAMLGVTLTAAKQIIASLTDAHLLDQREAGRFAFHDLIHEFIQAVTPASVDIAAARRRLVEYTHYLTATANALVVTSGTPVTEELPTPLREPVLNSPEEAMQWLEAERSNITTLILELIEPDPVLATGIAMRLWNFLNHAGYTGDWLEIFERLHESAAPALEAVRQGDVLNSLGAAYLRAGRYQEAIAIQQQGVSVREKLGDQPGLARSHGNLGLTYVRLGRYDEALHHYERGIEYARTSGDYRLVLAFTMDGLANDYYRRGDYASCLRTMLGIVGEAREHASPFIVGTMLVNIGECYHKVGEPTLALQYLDEGLAIHTQLGAWPSIAHALGNIADIRRDQGNPELAVKLRIEANELLVKHALHGEQIEGQIQLALAYIAAGEPEQALSTLEEALSLAIELGERHQEGNARAVLGKLLSAKHPAQAREHLTKAIAIIEPINAAQASALSSVLDSLTQP